MTCDGIIQPLRTLHQIINGVTKYSTIRLPSDVMTCDGIIQPLRTLHQIINGVT